MLAIPYALIDHTADLGVQVFGDSLETLHANAALALMDLITPLNRVKAVHDISFEVHGEDAAEVMVNWLREVLYQWTGKGRLIKSVHRIDVSDTRVRATLGYEAFDPDRHRIRHEIKAVTYHHAQVTQTASCWEARFILDT